MASISSNQVSSGTRNLIVGCVIAAMVVTLVFSLIGVGFAILFLALNIIASGVVLFITSLLSCILTTLQCLALRLGTIPAEQENWKSSLLRRSCSIGLPATIVLWLVVLAIDLSTNDALRRGSDNSSVQAAAVAVIAIAFISSTVLFCLIKTCSHLLNSGRLNFTSPILPYANQQPCGVAQMSQTQESKAAGRTSLLSLRPSPASLSAHVSPNDSSTNLSGLGIYQKPNPVQAEVRGQAYGKGSRRRIASRRSRVPSFPPPSATPSLFSSAPGPYVPHGPPRYPNHDSRWIATLPTSTVANTQQYQRSEAQSYHYTPRINTPNKPVSHREHLLRRISGLDRKSSKASTGRKVRNIPSSPTLGAKYDQNSHCTPRSPSDGLRSHRSRSGYGGQSQDSKDVVIGATPGTAIGGSCIALKRSSSSLSAPRHRSPLSMVQIAEDEEDAPETPIPQLLPELSKTNLGSIDMDEWLSKGALAHSPDPAATSKDNKASQVPGSMTVNKTHFSGKDFSFPLPPTKRSTSVSTDDRFSDAEDDDLSSGKASTELNSTDVEPGTVSTASVALQPPSKSRDIPSPLLVVKQVRSNNVNPSKGDGGHGTKVNADGDAKDGNQRTKVQSTSRPSTAATISSVTTAVSHMSDITALPAMPPPPPPPPLPPPTIWQQNSLHRRHQQMKGSRNRQIKRSHSLGKSLVEREKDSGIECGLWKALEDGADVDDGAVSGNDDLQADCGVKEPRSGSNRAWAFGPGSGDIGEGYDGKRGRLVGYDGLDASKGMVWGGSRRSSWGIL